MNSRAGAVLLLESGAPAEAITLHERGAEFLLAVPRPATAVDSAGPDPDPGPAAVAQP
ncbi:hypothetical protein ACIHCQ_34760 [Streptomyces sp. NPDC052236]|uniref:hypothetical protein n=1 Tax=Streptomyces sp. NPDC052236 TaxID=3365686 RepID=UPI0037D27703